MILKFKGFKVQRYNFGRNFHRKNNAANITYRSGQLLIVDFLLKGLFGTADNL